MGREQEVQEEVRGESMDRVRSEVKGDRELTGQMGREQEVQEEERGESMDRVRCEVRGGDREWTG